MIGDRDGTELFESHHLFTKKDLKDILASYEVKDCQQKIEKNGVFDWEHTINDPFTKELHEMAKKELHGVDIKADKGRLIQISILLAIALTQVY